MASPNCLFASPREIAQSYINQFQSLTPEHATAIFGIPPNETFNINVMNTILKETSTTYARKINKSNFMNHVSFHAFFDKKNSMRLGMLILHLMRLICIKIYHRKNMITKSKK